MKTCYALSIAAILVASASLVFSVGSPVIAKSDPAFKPVKVLRGTGSGKTETFTVKDHWGFRYIDYEGGAANPVDSSGKRPETMPVAFDGTHFAYTLFHRKDDVDLDRNELLPPFRIQDCCYVSGGGTFHFAVDTESPWKIEVYQLPDEIP